MTDTDEQTIELALLAGKQLVGTVNDYRELLLALEETLLYDTSTETTEAMQYAAHVPDRLYESFEAVMQSYLAWRHAHFGVQRKLDQWLREYTIQVNRRKQAAMSTERDRK